MNKKQEKFTQGTAGQAITSDLKLRGHVQTSPARKLLCLHSCKYPAILQEGKIANKRNKQQRLFIFWKPYASFIQWRV